MLSPVFELPPKTLDPVLEEQSLLDVEELMVVALCSFAENRPQPLGFQGSGFVRWVR